MKRLFSLVFVLFVSMITYAQGLYFDVGLGAGTATTEIDGENVSDWFNDSVSEIAIDVGMKLGYGPIPGTLIYIVGDISGIGHRFEDTSNYIQFNSYLIGPGIVIYPLTFLQAAGSVGYSYVGNQTDLPFDLYKSKGGVAANLSIAFDLGKGNNGCLLGVKYSITSNTLEVTNVKQESSLMSIFVKYAYRHKANK